MRWVIALALLGLADIIATHYQVILYGPKVELNPVQYWIISNIGMWAAYVFRLTGPIIGVSLLLYIRNTHPQYSCYINFWLYTALTISIGVMVWHAYLLFYT